MLADPLRGARKVAFIAVGALALTAVGLAGGLAGGAEPNPSPVPPVIAPALPKSPTALTACEAELDACGKSLELAEARLALQAGEPAALPVAPATPTPTPATPTPATPTPATPTPATPALQPEPPLVLPGTPEPPLPDDAGPTPPVAPTRAPKVDTRRDALGLDQVVAIVKGMKARPAAALAAGWDDALAVDVIGRLPARQAAELVAALPAEASARLTARLAHEGLPTPKPNAGARHAQVEGAP